MLSSMYSSVIGLTHISSIFGSKWSFPHMNLKQNDIAGCNLGFLSYSPTWMVECVLSNFQKKERERQWKRQISKFQQQEVIEVQLSIRSTGLCVSRLISCQDWTFMPFPVCDPPVLS